MSQQIFLTLLLVGLVSSLIPDADQLKLAKWTQHDLSNDMGVHREVLANLESLIGLLAKFAPGIGPILEGKSDASK